MYEFLKDFASPIITLVAAIVAAGITFCLGRAQTQIAKSQRDIALDKLKSDLFQRRYEIYQAAKVLIEHIMLVRELGKSEPSKVRSLYVMMDEARFYFPTDIIAFLDQLHADSEAFFVHLGEREQIDINDSEKWGACAEALSKDLAKLRAMYASLPEKFEATLSFKELTSPK